MKAFDRVLSTFGILLLLSFRADAHDPSVAHHEWYNKQVMSPAAQLRLGVPWESDCDNGDVFKTRFRVGEDRSDQWQYLKGAVAELVGIEGGVVSEVINLESSGVEAPDRRPRHDQHYHEDRFLAA